jgi:D-amino-acid dehydrogenase
MNLSSDERTIVVGGGIVGLSAACHLARRGARITLFERDRPALGASSGNAGILALGHPPLPHPGLLRKLPRLLLSSTNPVYVAPRASPSLLRFMLDFGRACGRSHFERSVALLARLGWPARECIETLIGEAGIDCDLHRTGWLEVFRTHRARSAVLRTAELLRGHGYTVDELDGDTLRRREPAFRDDVLGALHWVDSGFADPGRLVRGLVEHARRLGVELCFETPVDRLLARDGRFEGVRLADGRVVASRRAVLAAGAWSTELARTVGVSVPLQGGKGYHVNLRRTPHRPSTTCVCSETFVAVTPLDGGLRLAGTVELSGLNLRMVQARLDMLRVGARIYLRGIDDAEAGSTWCGLRPLTADGLPVVGFAPRVEGLFVVTGHAMMGFLLGPLGGKLASEALLDGKMSLDLPELDPARF